MKFDANLELQDSNLLPYFLNPNNKQHQLASARISDVRHTGVI
jgi:hypothetical protein